MRARSFMVPHGQLRRCPKSLVNPFRNGLTVVVIISLVGCSSLLESRTQELAINTDPPDAKCRLLRAGTIIDQIDSTPGIVSVRKSTYDIVIVCDKEGYEETSYVNRSDVAAATVGSMVFWGATGLAIDSATGRANKYDNSVTIKMPSLASPVGSPPMGQAASG